MRHGEEVTLSELLVNRDEEIEDLKVTINCILQEKNLEIEALQSMVEFLEEQVKAYKNRYGEL